MNNEQQTYVLKRPINAWPNFDSNEMVVELENDDYLFKVVVNSASGSFSNSSARLDDFTGFILVKKK